MTTVCPKCSSQIDLGANTPARPFNVRCPKCNSIVSVGSASPASEKSALAVGSSPSTERRRFEATEPAPLFQFQQGEKPGAASAVPVEDMAQVLANLLSQNSKAGSIGLGPRPAWDPRKALVCSAAHLRERTARQLAANDYQVFVAQDTRQAIDRMRENQLDVVVLDPEFDSEEQGAAFVMREVNILRPAERRRVFFVMLSPTQRTMEAHAAFLNNVNAIVNFREVEDLPRILAHALREYNELYKEFNLALNMPAL